MIPESEYLACRKLLSAIVSLAILDCCDKQIKISGHYKMSDKALDAFDFFFGDSEYCDIYLELLGFDPPAFKQRVVDMMHTKGGVREVDESKKLYFRKNYERYVSVMR